jgi:putative protease
MSVGQEIEIFGPDIEFFAQDITEMYDNESGEPIESAPHPQQIIKMKMAQPVKPNYILRKLK